MTEDCVHHYVINQVGLRYIGFCRKCGERRVFSEPHTRVEKDTQRKQALAEVVVARHLENSQGAR